jgi:hypothetical protein
MRSNNIESSSTSQKFARRYYPGAPAPRSTAAQLSFTIAITIEASRQTTMITMQMAQRRGMGRS